jgi:hypothetical protein
MKIADNRCSSKVMFKNILYGEIFEDEDGDICIRMPMIENEFSSWNAVLLSSGNTACFDDDDEVVKLNAELVISG